MSSSNELKALYKYMSKYRNKTGDGVKLPYTHTMVYEPYGSYNIPDEAYPKMCRLYVRAILANEKPHISEKHREYGPIIIDLDFVQPIDKSKRYYTVETIKNAIIMYNQIIQNYLSVNNMFMDAYVSEKKNISLRNGEYHDGIHIVYPYICTTPSLQFVMRKDFIKKLESNNIFSEIPLKNNFESVFDQNVIYKTGWLMYGSCKNITSDPYYVTHIYQWSNDKIFELLIPGTNINTKKYITKFVDLLSCRRFTDESKLTTLKIDPVTIDQKISKIKQNINNTHPTSIKIMGKDVTFTKTISEELLFDAKNLVKMLNAQRAVEWYSWYSVGLCLHNIDHRLLIDWIEFSKKCPQKFKQGECEKLWRSMKPNNYTMATLHYYATQDDPTNYLKYKKDKIDVLVKDSLDKSHFSIAKLLMEKYSFMYKCVSIKNDIWYEFKDHRWIRTEAAVSLRIKISEEISKLYIERQQKLYDISHNENSYEKKNILDEITRIHKIIISLNTNPFKNSVMKECAHLAYDPDFLKNLDENIYLLGFDNGVYDFETMQFRDGCPDDNISMTVGYNYIDLNTQDENYHEIMDFIKKIQPNKEIRNYLLTLFSTCLTGSVCEENFYVFTGSGSNGKSKLMELLSHTLGDYYKPMNIMLLVGKRASSSSATPELADKKGVRACPFDEPNANDELNMGFFKILSGGDKITARALFNEPIYFKPQFKCILLCNELPSIKADDDGSWRRLKVLPFLSKFVKPCDYGDDYINVALPENQFWADLSMSLKFPDWKQIFMAILIEYYKEYKQYGLKHPALVTKHTDAYRKKCDIYQEFIGDYFDMTSNPNDIVYLKTLVNAWGEWFRSNYTGKPTPFKELRNYISQRMGNCYDKRKDALTGYRIKTNEDEAYDNIEL